MEEKGNNVTTHSEILGHCRSWSFLVKLWSLKKQSFGARGRENSTFKEKILFLLLLEKKPLHCMRKIVILATFKR